jgi:hypothetical protein
VAPQTCGTELAQALITQGWPRWLGLRRNYQGYFHVWANHDGCAYHQAAVAEMALPDRRADRPGCRVQHSQRVRRLSARPGRHSRTSCGEPTWPSAGSTAEIRSSSHPAGAAA